MNDDINTKRTELANQMASAGAALLDFTGTAAALAAIPDTEPQQYVAACTPENIAAILPATICPQRRMRHGERPTEELQWEDTPAATSGDAPADPRRENEIMRKALEDIAQPADAGCGCSFPCRCDSEGAEAINAGYMRGIASDTLAEVARIERAAAPAPTDLSKRMRDAATAEVPYPLARLLIGGAEEIERYYGGMMAWKKTAEKKDADWNAERMARVDERCAARAASPATASGDLPKPWDARQRESEYRRTAESCMLEEIAELRAAVSAATKPTADLSKVPVVTYTKVVHQGWPEYNRDNEFSDGSSDGAALVKLDDVQSLLATKPAGVPTGYVLMPRRLTAENGAKSLFIGEFKESVELTCPDCEEAGEVCDDCETCGGSGTVSQPVTVEWDTIKRIYALAVEKLAAPTAAPADQVRNEALEEAALAAEKVQDDYREHQSYRWPEMRDDAETGAAACVTAIRALKSAATPTTEGASK